MKRPGCVVPLALFLAVVGGLWLWARISGDLRYRLTLYIDSNGQVVNGSSVYDTLWGWSPPPLAQLQGGRPWSTVVEGQALAVDLGNHGMLVAVMSHDPLRIGKPPNLGSSLDPAGLLAETFESSIGGMTWDLLRRIRDTRGPVDVPLQILPLLIRLGDRNDPGSIEWVNPYDLAANFGTGVKLVRATIEMTSDPVTTGIEEKLPWLALTRPNFWIVKSPPWATQDTTLIDVLPNYFDTDLGP
jgi:hypothetical protein